MRVLGLLSIIFLALALFGVQVKWGPDYSKTFSRLVAQKHSSIIYYLLIFILFLTTFSIFMLGWFVPNFKLPAIFTAVYLVGVMAQGICVTIPEVGVLKSKTHLLAAGVMSAAVFCQTVLILTLIPLKWPVWIIGVMSVMIMLAAWIGYIFKLGFIRNELAVQSFYFAGYLATVMLVSYIA